MEEIDIYYCPLCAHELQRVENKVFKCSSKGCYYMAPIKSTEKYLFKLIDKFLEFKHLKLKKKS